LAKFHPLYFYAGFGKLIFIWQAIVKARNQLRPRIESTNLQNYFFIWQAIVTVGCFYSGPFFFLGKEAEGGNAFFGTS